MYQFQTVKKVLKLAIENEQFPERELDRLWDTYQSLKVIKKISGEGEKSQLDAVFELNLTDEEKILDLLVKDQSLDVVDLSTVAVTDELKAVLPSNYINMNFIAPFKIEGKVLHIAISVSYTHLTLPTSDLV